jgi:hypothetical protein
MTNRVRIRLVPNNDPAFRAALERACLAAAMGVHTIDDPEGARFAEDHLRSNGYASAGIRLIRSVDEYRGHISNWLVWRDGLPWQNRG